MATRRKAGFPIHRPVHDRLLGWHRSVLRRWRKLARDAAPDSAADVAETATLLDKAFAQRAALLGAALDKFHAYRRRCEAQQEFGCVALNTDEDYWLTEAREAMFAAFDALEKSG